MDRGVDMLDCDTFRRARNSRRAASTISEIEREAGVVNVAVMGAGSWGTTLAKVFADAGNAVHLWARRAELARAINRAHENSEYLPGIVLPESIQAGSAEEDVLAEADIVVLGVPSQTLRENLERWHALIPDTATVVTISKGVEMGSYRLMSQVVEEAGGVPRERIVVLTGPNLAKEIALEQPAATVIACEDEERAKFVQAAVATGYLRPYTNTDVTGCEISGACKNVIALACGVAAGRGLGQNTLATVITRGLAEITRLGTALGADARTFSGLAGLGDLVATCTSPLSRNRSFGVRLGEGGTIAEATKETHGQVAEGVISSRAIFEFSTSLGVDMPITRAVFLVCHRGLDVRDMIVALMGRSKKAE